MNNVQIAPTGILDGIGKLFNSNISQKEFSLTVDKFIDIACQSNPEIQVQIKNELNIQDDYGRSFIDNTLQGHAIRKPYGYSGDFLIIDRMYTQYCSDIPMFEKWDRYMHNQSAPKAVRNRKDYFKRLVSNLQSSNLGSSILNIASGPARDVLEAIEEGGVDCMFHCVDMDSDAINYAQKLTQEYKDQIQFTNRNIFRFNTDEKHDLVWSAGLFDYFEDKAFVLLLKRFGEWVKTGGEIVIGNFNEDNNPSRMYMEVFGDWKLIHRTEEELVNLAIAAGYERSQIHVGREKENVNLFLHIQL